MSELRWKPWKLNRQNTAELSHWFDNTCTEKYSTQYNTTKQTKSCWYTQHNTTKYTKSCWYTRHNQIDKKLLIHTTQTNRQLWGKYSMDEHTHTQMVFWWLCLTCHPSSHSAVKVLPGTWSQNSLRAANKAATEKTETVPKRRWVKRSYQQQRGNVTNKLTNEGFAVSNVAVLVTLDPVEFLLCRLVLK